MICILCPSWPVTMRKTEAYPSIHLRLLYFLHGRTDGLLSLQLSQTRGGSVRSGDFSEDEECRKQTPCLNGAMNSEDRNLQALGIRRRPLQVSPQLGVCGAQRGGVTLYDASLPGILDRRIE